MLTEHEETKVYLRWNETVGKTMFADFEDWKIFGLW